MIPKSCTPPSWAWTTTPKYPSGSLNDNSYEYFLLFCLFWSGFLNQRSCTSCSTLPWKSNHIQVSSEFPTGQTLPTGWWGFKRTANSSAWILLRHRLWASEVGKEESTKKILVLRGPERERNLWNTKRGHSSLLWIFWFLSQFCYLLIMWLRAGYLTLMKLVNRIK